MSKNWPLLLRIVLDLGSDCDQRVVEEMQWADKVKMVSELVGVDQGS